MRLVTIITVNELSTLLTCVTIDLIRLCLCNSLVHSHYSFMIVLPLLIVMFLPLMILCNDIGSEHNRGKDKSVHIQCSIDFTCIMLTFFIASIG